jgi:RluA family pseudouridine synthase
MSPERFKGPGKKPQTRHPADFLADRVLYRDGLILVIDKPAGIVVHPNPKKNAPSAESLEDYFDALRFGLPRPPALAHRLDRDTTGCLVLGRHRKALAKLGKLFQQNRVEKTYWAISRGVPNPPEGRIDAAMKKHNDPSGWRMILAPDGLPAVTEYRLIASKDGLSFIELKPQTGRTHQIRVHLASIGCPILGEPQYGDLSVEDRARPMMLHARRIELPLSKTGPPIVVEAPAPKAMALALEAFC